MKLDPIRGAEDITNYGFMCSCLGSVFYCMGAGGVMDILDSHNHIEPLNFFAFSAFVGLLIFIFALLYPSQSEIDAHHHTTGHTTAHASASHHHEFTMKEKF